MSNAQAKVLFEKANEILGFEIQPDIIHLEELPEYFMSDDIAKKIYTDNRNYKIFETCHDSSFNTNNKRFSPDKFILVSNYQVKMLDELKINSEVVEYPIEYKSNETEPYYPVNDSINNLKFLKYKKLSDNQSKYFFGGRLSEYKYYDMHQVIKSALSFVKNVIQLK